MANAVDQPGRVAGWHDVLRSGEFRSVYAATVLSWLGDYLARAAITAMVFDRTGSAAASAAAFAISFAPWLLGGSVLVAVAERYPNRRIMAACDIARMLIMALVALNTGAPLWVLLGLLLLSSLFTPPFEASRSALLPTILGPTRYVSGVALQAATSAPIQIGGYFLGAALAVVDAPLALGINAATFGASALLVLLGVRPRAAALAKPQRTGLLQETADGFRIVFGHPVRRFLVLLVLCGSLFAVVPEGLGAVWAARYPDGVGRAWAQGLIMSAVPAGLVLGSLVVSHFVPQAARRRLLPGLAVATPLVLVPVLANPPAPVVAALATLCGFAMGMLVPSANGEFVQTLPKEYRARAFGVVSAGLQLLQGSAVLLTGALAQRIDVPVVVGLWSLFGVLLMLGLLTALARPEPAVAEAGPAVVEAGPAVVEAGPAT